MKRILIALCLVCLLPICLLAEGDREGDVNATYVPTETKKVYSVDISWSGLDFTYNGPSKGTWDPSTHVYENPVPGSWAEGNGTITITNHSNSVITAKFDYTPELNAKDVSMTFGGLDNNSKITVDSADNGDGQSGTAKEKIVTVKPNGQLSDSFKNKEKIGTIKITLDYETTNAE